MTSPTKRPHFTEYTSDTVADPAKMFSAHPAHAYDGIIYLASPYSHIDPKIMEWRYGAVCRAAAYFIDAGHLIYSPIAHSHAIAVVGGLNGNFEFWSRFDYDMITRVKAMWILGIDGWERSHGVTAELDHCEKIEKPVILIRPVGKLAEIIGESS